MATRKSSKGHRNNRSQHSVPAVRKTPQTIEGSRWLTDAALAQIKATAREEGRQEIFAALSAPRAKSAATLERERIEREGLTLKPLQLEQAQQALDDLAFTLRSIHRLAWLAEEERDTEDQGDLLTATRNSAIAASQYCELAQTLLGDEPKQVLSRRFELKQEPKAGGENA